MEEDKKEVVGEELKSEKKMHGFHRFNLGQPTPKMARAVLIAFAIFAIFSMGVCFGSHRNREDKGDYRGYQMNNFKQRGNNEMMQRGGGRMMQDNRMQGEVSGGCPMQNATYSVQSNGFQTLSAGFPMQGQTTIQAVTPEGIKVAAPVQVKAAVPATPAK